MKTTTKIIFGCALYASSVLTAFGQAPMTSTEEGGKKPAAIDKAKVPVVVTKAYVVEYPATTTETWYAYPASTDATSDWYGYDSYDTYAMVTSDQEPEYYVVEFTSNKMPYKAMYSKEGKKMSTTKKMNGELPKAVLDALNKSAYKGWMVKKEKEEIWKEADKTKTKVYKVVVENGKEKHCLIFQPDGTLLKDKNDKSVSMK